MSVDEPSPQDEQDDVISQEEDTRSYEEMMQDKEWAEFEAKQKAEDEEPLEETDDPDDGQDDDDTAAEEIGDDPGVPEIIMQAALAQGFSAQDVQALGAARTAELVLQRSKESLVSQQHEEAKQQHEGSGQPGEASEKKDFKFEEIKLENPDDYDESTLKVIEHVNAMGKALEEQHSFLQPMQSQFAQWQQQHQQQQIEQTNRMFDEMFAEASKDFGDIFGKGSLNEISQEEFDKRSKVVQTALALHQTNPSGDIKDSFVMAARANYADVISERKAEQLREDVKKQSGKRVGAASGKRKPQRPDLSSLPPDHPDYAAHFARKWAMEEA